MKNNTLKDRKKFSYYNFNKLLSYGAVYNFLVGARGLGKTYGAKKRAIRDALLKDKQFIYLRRYKSELDGRGTFFSDIAHEFPKWDLKVSGDKALGSPVESRGDKKRQWKELGFFVALSTASTKKGVSYHNVYTIIFDEFIIEKGVHHYLKNETRALNDFYSTVDRNQDKTKVFFLANGISIMNPYFVEYDIRPDQLPEFSTHFNSFVCVHFAESKDFQNEVYQTRFGKFIQGTEYGAYSVESQFKDNHGLLIDYKPSDAKYIQTMETRHGTFSVWLHYPTYTYFIREKRPKNEVMVTLLQESISTDKMFMARSHKRLQNMRAAFNKGQMFFESPRERNAFTEIFRQY